MNKKIIAGIVVAIAFIAWIAWLSSASNGDSKTAVVWPSGTVNAMGATEYDWGEINIKGGEVEHVFDMVNSSKEPLLISHLTTSCMCTSVTLVSGNGDESMEFGLHSKRGPWERVIQPGEQFKIKAVFDPMAHGPDAVGPITRSVVLETSAAPDGVMSTSSIDVPKGSVTTLQLSGDVLYEEAFLALDKKEESIYTNVQGDFAFAEAEHEFGVLKQSGGIVSYDFPFVYNGTETVEVTGVPTSCACTSAEIDVSTLSSGDEGVLTVSFDPNLHEEPEGRFFKTISILTSPELDTVPEVKIWAEIDLDLGAGAYKLQE